MATNSHNNVSVLPIGQTAGEIWCKLSEEGPLSYTRRRHAGPRLVGARGETRDSRDESWSPDLGEVKSHCCNGKRFLTSVPLATESGGFIMAAWFSAVAAIAR